MATRLALCCPPAPGSPGGRAVPRSLRAPRAAGRRDGAGPCWSESSRARARRLLPPSRWTARGASSRFAAGSIEPVMRWMRATSPSSSPGVCGRLEGRWAGRRSGLRTRAMSEVSGHELQRRGAAGTLAPGQVPVLLRTALRRADADHRVAFRAVEVGALVGAALAVMPLRLAGNPPLHHELDGRDHWPIPHPRPSSRSLFVLTFPIGVPPKEPGGVPPNDPATAHLRFCARRDRERLQQGPRDDASCGRGSPATRSRSRSRFEAKASLLREQRNGLTAGEGTSLPRQPRACVSGSSAVFGAMLRNCKW